MFCKKCGNEIKDGVKFCAKCGTAVNSVLPVQATPVSTGSQAIGNTYTFKNTPNTRSVIRYIKGGKVIFKFDKDNFSWQRELQYDEEIISIPYYLVNNFKFENKVSIGMILTAIFAFICGFACILSEFVLEGFGLMILSIAVSIFFSVNTCFFLFLKDGSKYKVKLRKIRKNKMNDRDQMIAALESQIRNAQNTGDSVQKCRTGATVGDVISAIKNKNK